MSDSLVLKVFSLASATNSCIDGTLIVVSIGCGIFGIINIIIIDTFSGIGYFLACALALISLWAIKRMRLRATIQKSVNVLKQENNELKENNEILQENNEDLKENVGELETHVDQLENKIITLKTLEIELKDDIEKLKNLLGIVGINSKDAVKEIKEILNRLKTENDKHGILVKNQIITYLYTQEELSLENREKSITIYENFKDILCEFYPDLCWDGIIKKIKNKELL